MPLADAGLDRMIAEIPFQHFHGRVWRVHWREVAADDWSLSHRTSGRYHRGLDLFPPDQTFPVLYTSLAPEIAIWEMVRRSALRNLTYLKNNVLTELEVDLDRMLDVSDPVAFRLTQAAITGADLRPCQEIAAIARSLGIQGLLVPSAAMLGLNLVLIPDNLASSERVRIVRRRELPLDLAAQDSVVDAPWQDR